MLFLSTVVMSMVAVVDQKRRLNIIEKIHYVVMILFLRYSEAAALGFTGKEHCLKRTERVRLFLYVAPGSLILDPNEKHGYYVPWCASKGGAKFGTPKEFRVKRDLEKRFF
uniref:Uncharacterized protein n=1 Tax=Leptocylindrus danicus TaxID=163516 RepID=A0A7S2L414_9STRA